MQLFLLMIPDVLYPGNIGSRRSSYPSVLELEQTPKLILSCFSKGNFSKSLISPQQKNYFI